MPEKIYLRVEEKLIFGIPKLKKNLLEIHPHAEDVTKVLRLIACVWVAESFCEQGTSFSRINVNIALREVIDPHFSWHSALNYLKSAQAVDVLKNFADLIKKSCGQEILNFVVRFVGPNRNYLLSP